MVCVHGPSINLTPEGPNLHICKCDRCTPPDTTKNNESRESHICLTIEELVINTAYSIPPSFDKATKMGCGGQVKVHFWLILQPVKVTCCSQSQLPKPSDDDLLPLSGRETFPPDPAGLLQTK